MGPKKSKRAIEQAIERDKQDLQEALGRLSHCVKDEVDPRVRIAKSPYLALGLSFAVGFVFAAVQAPRSIHAGQTF